MSNPVPYRGGGFRPKRIRGVGLAVFITLLLIAEWGTRAGWITNLTLPRPSDVLLTLYELAASGLLWTHLSLSLGRLGVGAFLGAGAGVMVGVALQAPATQTNSIRQMIFDLRLTVMAYLLPHS